MDRCWYKAEWVLPISSPPLRDGVVEVEGERIARVFAADAGPAEPPERVVDLGAAVLMPGLVDLSSRLELTAFRGLFPESRQTLWIEDLTRARYKVLQPGDSLTSALWGTIESIRGGITAMADVGSTRAGAMALCQMGLRGTYYLEVFGPHPRQATEALEKTVRDLVDLAEILPSKVKIGVSPLAVYTVSPALFKDVARLARRHELDICIHAAESRAECDFVHSNSGALAELHRRRMHPHVARGMSPLQHLESLGILACGPLLVHGVHLDEADRSLACERGVRIAHCPRSNAFHGHGVAPVKALMDSGVPVGLGSAAALPHAIADILDEARTAASLTRAAEKDTSALTEEIAWRMATLEGARILGLESIAGSLESGKQADIVGVALSGPGSVAAGDPGRALLADSSRRDVILTVAAGRVLHRAGQRTELDEIEETLRPMFVDLRARLMASL